MRPVTRTLLQCALLLTLILTPAIGSTAAGTPLEVARSAIDAARLANPYGAAQFAMSSDGRTIAYVAAKAKPEGDAYSVGLWVGDVRSPKAHRLLVQLPDSPSSDAQPTPRFSPDGTRLAYLGEGSVELVDIATGAKRSLTKDRLPKGTTPLDFSWAPDGRRLALRLAMPAPEEPTGGKEMTVSWPLGGDPGPGTRVALLDLAAGPVELITGPELDVSSMNWASDGKRLVLAATPVEERERFYQQDIYILDIEQRAAKLAVKLDGVDSEPLWSPDGRWIAFATQAGEGNKDWLQVLGLLDVETGKVSFPARREFDAGLGTPHHLTWAPDGRLYFISGHHLHAPIFEVRAQTGRSRQVSPLDGSYLSGLTISPNGKTLLFGRGSVNEPLELYSSESEGFAIRRVTNLNPGFSVPPNKVRIVSWKSAEGRWDLDGVLITPAGSKPPWPLITLIEGGPSMVRLEFELGQQQRVHALVAAGYAVFLPNTRGRSGYSKAFRRAIPDNKDFVAGGYGDLMSGVDMLVSTGVADPEKLGISGFSYGAVLTAYTITQTRRFKAASINEAPANWPYIMSLGAANRDMQTHWRDQAGYSDPYDPTERALMEAQSPIYHIAQVRTPALLEYGVKQFGGLDEMGGGELFHGLRRFNIPSELIRYPRTGHGISEPRLLLESARRNLEWFDYWLLGRATERMQRSYRSGEAPPRETPQ